MYKSTIFYLTLLLCSFNNSISAQKWSYSAHIGTTAAISDVSEQMPLTFTDNRTALSASLNYSAFDCLLFRFNATNGRLSAHDNENKNNSWRKQRGFSFQTPFVETSILVEFDGLTALLSQRETEVNHRLTTHFLVGAGMTYIAPSVNFNEPNPATELVYLDKQAVFARTQFVVPVGFAVKWHINDKSALRIEGVLRKTFSDYFEGVSKSGGPKYNDYYSTLMIGFERKLSWGLKNWKKYQFFNIGAYCPTFK